jgi:serine/threonine protein kinase/Tol biopolymer transport system component
VTEQNRWKDISRVYDEALRRPESCRSAYLQEACNGDAALRCEVESLLSSAAAAGDFMSSPATADVIVELRAETVSLVGRHLACYRIDALLGAGGMGEVYRATDTRLNRTVAIKILPQHLREVPRLRDRFEREARAVAALRHPHICVLYDIGEDDGIAFLVMEMLEGETLAARLARGPLGREELFRSAIDMSDALAETHRQGVVHGDLKPGNVMLTGEGAKLLDFGLATLNAEATAAAGSFDDANVSATTIGGTLGYMAPEQLQGGTSDWRSDIFAFGAILHEMVTAEKAFPARTAPPVTGPLMADPSPALPADAPTWARALAPMIQRCLAQDPRDRWGRTLDMADELRRLSISSNDAPAASRGSHAGATVRWWRLTAFVILASAAVWFVADRWLSRPPISPPATARTTPLSLGNMRVVTADDRLEVDPSFSPDGRFVAYAAGTSTGMRIFIRALDEGPARPLTGTPDALEFHPRWSPDGLQILYVSPAGAFVAAVAGGVPRRVDSPTDAPGSYSATTPSTARRIFSSAVWSPDGRRLAIAYGGSLSVVAADGTGERRRIGGSSPYELHSCDWSPDGRWIACVSGNWSSAAPGGFFGNLSPSAVVLIPTEGGGPVEVMPRTAVHRSPVWARDGRRLYFVTNREGSSDIYSIEIDADGASSGNPVRTTTGLGVYSMAFSADGRRLAYAAYSARANIWSVPISSAGPLDLSHGRAETSGAQTIEAMRVTRDGRWLLYDSNLHGTFDIFRVPIEGGAVERLTDDPGDEFAPDLSSDGASLAYHSWRTGSRDIFVKAVGGSIASQVTGTSSQESFPTWSPDGRAIAFLDQFVEDGVARGAFLTRQAGSGNWGPPVRLRAGTSRVSWSADGRFIAYAHRGAVETLDLDADAPRVVFAPRAKSTDPLAESVQVAFDRRTLYFKSHDERGRASLWSVPVGGGTPRLLVRLDDSARPSSRTDFAAGADRLYFAIDDRRCNLWLAEVTAR